MDPRAQFLGNELFQDFSERIRGAVTLITSRFIHEPNNANASKPATKQPTCVSDMPLIGSQNASAIRVGKNIADIRKQFGLVAHHFPTVVGKKDRF